MFNQSVGLNYVLTLDAQGKPTPYATQAHGPWPYWGNPFGVCMFPDNTHLVVPAFLDNLGTTFGFGALGCHPAGRVRGSVAGADLRGTALELRGPEHELRW